MENIVHKLILDLDCMHEYARQRCFSFGNPFFHKCKGDGDYYTKELPSGERFLVVVMFLFDDNGSATGIVDEVISRKSR